MVMMYILRCRKYFQKNGSNCLPPHAPKLLPASSPGMVGLCRYNFLRYLPAGRSFTDRLAFQISKRPPLEVTIGTRVIAVIVMLIIYLVNLRTKKTSVKMRS
jgi:hypothetical protein